MIKSSSFLTVEKIVNLTKGTCGLFSHVLRCPERSHQATSRNFEQSQKICNSSRDYITSMAHINKSEKHIRRSVHQNIYILVFS